MARVVVIGAGIGGLATAARLAVRGHDVTVLAAEPEVGGTTSPHRRAGFAFRETTDLFGLPAVLRDLFAKTGDPLEDCVDLVPAEPGMHLHAAGVEIPLPGVGVGAVAAALGRGLGTRAGQEWREVMARGGMLWQCLRAGTVRDCAARGLDLGRTDADPDDARLRSLLGYYALAGGPDPVAAGLAAHVLPYMYATFGLWRVAGGPDRVADALATRIAQRGGNIRLATGALEVLVGDLGVRGVSTTTGDVVPADIVVIDAPTQPMPCRLVLAAVRMPRPTDAADPTHGQWPGAGEHVWLSQPHVGDGGGGLAAAVISASVSQDPRDCPPGHQSWTIRVPAAAPGPLPSGPGAEPGDISRAVLAELATRGADLREQLLWLEELGAPALRRGVHPAVAGGPAGAPLTSPVPGVHVLGECASLAPATGKPVAWASIAQGTWAGIAGAGMAAEVVAAHIGRAR